MKKLIIFILITTSSFAKDYFQCKSKFPIEFELILEAYQENDLNREEQQELADLIKRFDHYFSNSKNLSQTLKASIYKSLLRVPFYKSSTLEPASVKELKFQYPKLSTDFSKWISSSLYKDADLLFSSDAHKEYLLQKSEGELKSPNAKMVSKKIQILNRLYSYFPVEDIQLEIRLKDSLLNILKNIHFSLVLQSDKTEKIEMPETLDKLKHFTYSPARPLKANNIQKTPEKSRTVEEILDSNGEPPISKPDNSKATLPAPTNDADWLQDF